MKNKIINNQNGLSLLEILIAISVLSFMMIGVIDFTETTFDTAETVSREDAESLQIETAMGRLDWDFAHIYSPLYFDHRLQPDQMSENEAEVYNQMRLTYETNNRFKSPSYTGLPIPEFEAKDKSTLIFFTASNRRKFEDAKQSNFSWVRYSLIPNDEEIDESLNDKTAKEAKKTLMLVRQVKNTDIYNPDRIDWDDIKEQVLHRKIDKLIFEFWNPKTFKWVTSLRTIENGQNIIHAIKVKIEYYSPDNTILHTERIFRPLYPQFVPEDTYKFLNAKPETTTNGEGNNNTTNSGSSISNTNTTNSTESGDGDGQ